MAILLLVILLVFSGILPGMYLSLKHILGWKFLQGNATRYLEHNEIIIFLLRAVLFMLFFFFILSGSALFVGFAVLFAVLNLLILKWLKRRQWPQKPYQRVLFSGAIVGSMIGGIWSGMIWSFSGTMFHEDAMIATVTIFSIFGGGIGGGLTNVAVIFACFIGDRFGRLWFKLIAPLFILPRFATIICNRCHRMTAPLKCRYDLGRRYCEHCQQTVEDSKEFGKVVFTFGDVSFTPQGRAFVLTNPELEHKDHHVEVSEIYIDPPTADKRLLERFLTYIINYPPKKGIQAVKIFYQDQLDDLGGNLKNALRNTFPLMERIYQPDWTTNNRQNKA